MGKGGEERGEREKKGKRVILPTPNVATPYCSLSQCGGPALSFLGKVPPYFSRLFSSLFFLPPPLPRVSVKAASTLSSYYSRNGQPEILRSNKGFVIYILVYMREQKSGVFLSSLRKRFGRKKKNKNFVRGRKNRGG